MTPASIPWRLILIALALALEIPAFGAQQEAGWKEAPEHLRLFAPRLRRDSYRADVSPLRLDEVLSRLGGDPALIRTPGAWQAQEVGAFDIFGRSGDYDRVKLARLYGARRARVARGARTGAGGVVESWTLVSPYPSATLGHLESGTLRIVLTAPVSSPD